jgi:hypothetical protein
MGYLSKSQAFPLNKKERLVFANYLKKEDYNNGYGRMAPWWRLKESNVPITLKI